MSDVWTRYLDALEATAHAAVTRLAAGEAPDLDSLRTPAPPPGAVPAALRDRAQAVLDQLTDVTAQVRARRDALAAQLTALPRRRGPAEFDRGSTLGATVDVQG